MTRTCFTETVFDVIAKYPEAEWDERIQAEFPEASHDEIVAAIEVAMGGDVVVVEK